ncbi:hypothetical protein Ancab_004359 [Ancistrocladus abbreviatus]
MELHEQKAYHWAFTLFMRCFMISGHMGCFLYGAPVTHNSRRSTYILYTAPDMRILDYLGMAQLVPLTDLGLDPTPNMVIGDYTRFQIQHLVLATDMGTIYGWWIARPERLRLRLLLVDNWVLLSGKYQVTGSI